ncbi:recombination endonuclease VII [Streptomyces sp. Ag109_O5-1]|uniref:endonuclease VII domain-containing protein n=1 Tax=Streptomyces sp. Ag109_O5-1 TaxID=1938851 RepID=UPI000F4D5D51|nr:endonuclease VII domain-containing protein [Streptomyces sp. Ag109_O5-1]RPE39764.1 recombination endonuclease VII [Streptomyces sp. Ag109_O5-1]
MTIPPNALGYAALTKRMGWASVRAATVMNSRAKRRRENGTSRPGDLPAPDGYAGQSPYWFESTVDDWAAGRPRVGVERDRPDGLRQCSKCDTVKPPSEFHTYSDGRTGEVRLMAKCKACHLGVALAWNQRNPERAAAATARWKQRTRKRYKARLYGITEDQLVALEAAHDGRCQICGEVPDDGLAVDHDHGTGHVRGLLCRTCNVGLGAFGDDPRLMMAAIRYLEESRERADHHPAITGIA